MILTAQLCIGFGDNLEFMRDGTRKIIGKDQRQQSTSEGLVTALRIRPRAAAVVV